MKRLLLALALCLAVGVSADTTMQIRNGVLTTDMNANNFKIINLQLPISPNDAANKAYVDSVAGGGGGGGGGAGLPIMAGQSGKFLTTDGSIALWSTVPWTAITGQPTSLLGYGITDPVVLTSGSYANPSWITSLVWGKITGTPTTLAGYGIPTPLPISAIPVGTTNTTVAVGNDTRFPSNVTGLRKGGGVASLDIPATPNTDYVTPDAAGRTALSLVIGTNVQAWDDDLEAISHFTSVGIIPYRSGVGTWGAVGYAGNISFSNGILSVTGGTGGVGDVSSNVGSGQTVAGQAAVFADANGKLITPSNASGVGILATGVLGAVPILGIAQGGTALSTMGLGEIYYGSAVNVTSRLSPNTTINTPKYLRSLPTGTGVATAPFWSQIAFAELDQSTLPTTLAGYHIADALKTSNNLSEYALPNTAPISQPAARANLGLVIGPSVSPAATIEAWDADLDSIAAISPNNVIPRHVSAGTWGTVTIGTGLTLASDGTLSLSAGSANVISDVPTPPPNVPLNEIPLFSSSDGKHIARSNTTLTGIVKQVPPAGATTAAPNIDYSVASEAIFNVIGTAVSPQSWATGKTVMSEGTTLNTADGYAILPVANTFAPGTILTYIDTKTTGNFGRNFRPFANGNDTLDGLTNAAMATAGTWFKPFISGATSPGQGVYQFKTDGGFNWTSIYTNGRAFKLQSPIDANKQVFFDVEDQGIGIPKNVIRPATGGDSVTVRPTDPSNPPPPGAAVINVTGPSGSDIGTLSYNQIVPDPTSVSNGQVLVTSGGAWTTGSIAQSIAPWNDLCLDPTNCTTNPIKWIAVPGQGQQNAYMTLSANRTLRIAGPGLQAGQTFNLFVKQNTTCTSGCTLNFETSTQSQYFTPSNGQSTIAQTLAPGAVDYYEIKYTGLSLPLPPFLVTNVKLNLTAVAPPATCNTTGTTSGGTNTTVFNIGSLSNGGDIYKSAQFIAATGETSVCKMDVNLFQHNAPNYNLHAAIYTDGPRTGGVDNNGVTNGTSTVTSTTMTWVASDVGQHITSSGTGATDIPPNTYIGSVDTAGGGHSITLVNSPLSGGTAVVAGGSHTGVTLTTYGVPLAPVGTSTPPHNSINIKSTSGLPLYANAAAATAAGFTGAPTADDTPATFVFDDVTGMTPGATYHVVVWGDGAPDGVNWISWIGGTVQSGFNHNRSGNATTWVVSTTARQLRFKTYHP